MTATNKLRDLEKAATPAPWIRVWASANVRSPLSEYILGADQPLTTQQQRDIDLCVAVRNDLEKLLDVVDAAREVMNYPRGERDLYATNTLRAALDALDAAQ